MEMNDQIFKTPQNLVTRAKTFGALGDCFDIQMPQEHSGQDVIIRRSPRNVGKDSVVKKLQMKSLKTYPGSSTRPQTRRSFRTPVQTLPLKADNGKVKGSASKSFAVAPDQDDMFTPRSNIDGLLAVTNTEPRTFKLPEEGPQKAVTRSKKKSLETREQSLKTQVQAPVIQQPRNSISDTNVLTLSNNMTPRSNIWNFLQDVYAQEQTPVVGTDGQSPEPSVKTSISAVKHQNWGQEVTVSPLYMTQISDDREDSPPTSVKSLRKRRKSFHIPTAQTTDTASQGIHEQTSNDQSQAQPVGTNGQSQNLFAELSVSAIRHRNFGQEVSDLSPMYLADSRESEEDPFAAVEQFRKKRQSFHIPVSQTTASQTTESDKWQVRGTHDESGNVKEHLGISTAPEVKKLNTPLISEDIHSNASGVDKSMSAVTAGSKVINVNAANEEENQKSFLYVSGGKEHQPKSNLSREVAAVTVLETVCDITQKYIESAAQDGTSQFVIDKEISPVGSRPDTSMREDSSITSAKGDENGLHENSNKDKSSISNRTSFSSKHGAISYSISPKKDWKSSQYAPIPNASVYDLSDTSSNSSINTEFPKQRRLFQSPQKRSALKRRSINRSNATEILGQSLHSGKKSKLSYSEWKSLQTGADTPGPSASFLTIPPRLSSTPFDRTKRVFHSTRMHNSTTARTSDDQGSFMVDATSNISPIPPDGRIQGQREMLSRRELLVNMDVDKGGDINSTEDGNGAVFTQVERQVEADAESSSDETLGLSPLSTPHIDMGKKRKVSSSFVQDTIQKHLVGTEASGSAQKQKKGAAKVGKLPGKRTKKNSQVTAMSRKSVKFFAERHTNMKLSKDSIEEIEMVSEQFWDNTFLAAEAFALHAGRKTIVEEDIILLMKTQRLVGDDPEELYDLIRKYLPMELRSELIPMALPLT